MPIYDRVPVEVYCGNCNEKAEICLTNVYGPPAIFIGQQPRKEIHGEIICFGCNKPGVMIAEGRDEGYEISWLWEAVKFGL